MAVRPQAPRFKKSVFVNCPFDAEYRPLFRATVFTILACGYRPRCAWEIDDASQTRIDQLYGIIHDCMHAIHDLSRSEVGETPRYNMPLELGIFMGAKRYGGQQQKTKRCLVMENKPYQWQKYLSDMAGNDIIAHGNRSDKIIGLVRDFLNSHRPKVDVPGARFVRYEYNRFSSELPGYLERLGHEDSELQFKDLLKIVIEWQKSRMTQLEEGVV